MRSRQWMFLKFSLSELRSLILVWSGKTTAFSRFIRRMFSWKISQEFTSVLTLEGKILERSLSTPANHWVRLVNCSMLWGGGKKLLFYVRTGMTLQEVCQLICKLLYHFSYKRSHLSKTKNLHYAKCRFKFYVHVTVHRNKFLCNKTN